MGSEPASPDGAARGTPVAPPSDHLLDMLPGLVAYFDHDLRYVYANATYLGWAGLAPQDIVGRHCREIVGRSNYALVASRLRRALRGEPVTSEYSLFDGEHARRVQGSYVPDRDAEGRVRGVIALVTDISQRADLQRRLDESNTLLHDSFARAPIGMAATDAAGRLIRVNDSFAAMLGYGPAEMEGIDFRTITHAEDVGLDDRLFGQVLAGRRDGYRLDKRYLHRSGSIVHGRLAVSAVRDAAGQVTRFVAQIEDVTARIAAEAELARTNARLAIAIEATRGGLWHIDIATGHFAPSRELAETLGLDPAAGQPISVYLDRMDPHGRRAGDTQALLTGQVERHSAEYRLDRPGGTRWMRSDRRLLRDPDGMPIEIVGIDVDITEQRERQNRAERQANTDPLTGLLNRRGLDRALGKAQLETLGLLLVDLDGFKPVNDRFGHHVGDAVLAETARRLQSLVRDEDAVARLGGDEFLLAMPGAGKATLAHVATRINVALALPFRIGDVEVTISASIGAALRAGDAPLAATIAVADRALYRVKSAGRGSWLLAS